MLNKALVFVNETGIEMLTARNLASALNISTAPIYSIFSSLQELKDEVMRMGINLLIQYTSNNSCENEMLNIGIGYIRFSRDYSKLYRSMFLSGNNYKELADEFDQIVLEKFKANPWTANYTPEEINMTMEQMRYIISGMAALISNQLVPPPSDEEIVAKISKTALSMARCIQFEKELLKNEA
ncbi:MAG: hypothetical protein NT007_15120 [Candidatus Kapabacteria bacterium]|nr:hypothetical protein [Candidatus Kapabacteria bacterium]